MSRLPRWLSVLLLVAGIGLLLTPLASEAYTRYSQRKLLAELDDPVLAIPTDVYLWGGLTGDQTDADEPEPPTPPLEPPFRMEIPRLGVEAVVVAGVGADELRVGPGLYPQGVQPGETGNVAIAGHRTTYGAWFRHVDELDDGDEIILSKGARRIAYQVEKVFVTTSDDWSVIAPTDFKALTLTTCHPPGSLAERLIVRARETEDSYAAPRS